MEVKLCEQCGEQFTPKRPHGRFDTEECRYQGWIEEQVQQARQRVKDRAGSRGGTVRSVEQARDLQEASPDKAYWSAKIREHIGRTLLATGFFHPDDIDPLNVPADCANVIGAQINSYSRRRFMVEVGRRRMAHKAANGRKATIWQVTDKGRRELPGIVGRGGPLKSASSAQDAEPGVQSVSSSPASSESEPASLFPDDTGKAAPLNPLRDREAA